MTGPIVVAIDFSRCSGAALRQAARIAQAEQAPLIAVHVVEPLAPLTPDPTMPFGVGFPLPVPEDLAGEARRRWPAFAQAVGIKDVPLRIEVGNPRERILDVVRRDKPRVLVVGAHSDTDQWRGIGTNAAALAQRATTMVLVVRREQPGPFRSVVACIDFSETSRAALREAAGAAARDGGALHILHVFTDPWLGFGAPESIATNMPDFATRYRQAVEERLRAFCGPVKGGAVAPVFHALRAASHAEGIIRFVTEHRCELAVLGTRGRWNVRDYFMGSTADRAVREAACSVLAVKPTGFAEAWTAGAGQPAADAKDAQRGETLLHDDD